jgi:GDP-L-fucose synthase
LAVMPTNLYGPGDSYDLNNSHVIPALIRKFHEAKVQGNATVTIWGTGTPRREFLYSDDMADACVYLMSLPDEQYSTLLGSDEALTGAFMPPLINIGVGEDQTIQELAEAIREIVGYTGDIIFDIAKPDGTPRKLMDVTKLNVLGWRAKTAFGSGLEETYHDYLRRYA